MGQCVGACEQNLGQVGANVVEITRSQDGVTFTPLPAQQIEPDGIVSGIVTDSNGGVYIAHTGLVDSSGNIAGGADANGNDNAVVVVRFPDGYSGAVSTPLATGQPSARCRRPRVLRRLHSALLSMQMETAPLPWVRISARSLSIAAAIFT